MRLFMQYSCKYSYTSRVGLYVVFMRYSCRVGASFHIPRPARPHHTMVILHRRWRAPPTIACKGLQTLLCHCLWSSLAQCGLACATCVRAVVGLSPSWVVWLHCWLWPHRSALFSVVPHRLLWLHWLHPLVCTEP